MQFVASQSTSNLLSGVLNKFWKNPSLFSSKLPQQVSQVSFACEPTMTIADLQQQLSEL
jgi:hypothetical protein